MGHAQAFEAFLACIPESRGAVREPGLPGVLGQPAWQRLPHAVRERFGEPPHAADYAGCFEVVQASLAGRILAEVSRLLGTPVVPRTGRNVAAIVRVTPVTEGGVRWTRQYRWPDNNVSLVRSTKAITADGTLVEHLPARLCMELHAYEERRALHFLSRRYYFELPLPWKRRRGRARLRLPLPRWLSPGTVHVVHEDEAQGWFRFTMTVTHPLLGRLFYQTGRFHALGD
jgi:hypothetical protein